MISSAPLEQLRHFRSDAPYPITTPVVAQKRSGAVRHLCITDHGTTGPSWAPGTGVVEDWPVPMPHASRASAKAMMKFAKSNSGNSGCYKLTVVFLT